MAILVDSCVWIAGSRSESAECLQLRRLIRAGESLAATHFIQAEVCQGARTEESFHALWESFLGFAMIEVTPADWGRAAWNYFRCRKRGITTTTLDCLIATLAVEHQLALWTIDRGLARLEPIIGFDLFTPTRP